MVSNFTAIFGNIVDNEKISLHMQNCKVMNLGPGNRYGIWVQGCLKYCPNCMAPEAQKLTGGGYEIECSKLADEIINASIDFSLSGITISGGEPLLQWKALKKVLSKVKQSLPKLNILLYTGYSFEGELMKYLTSEEDFYREFKNFFSLLDWWIDGEYVENENDGKGLRGSANQSLFGNIFHKVANERIISKQLKANEWKTLVSSFITNSYCKPIVKWGTSFKIDKDLMKDFQTNKRSLIIDSNGLVTGIPTLNELEAYETYKKTSVSTDNNEMTKIQSSESINPISNEAKNKSEDLSEQTDGLIPEQISEMEGEDMNNPIKVIKEGFTEVIKSKKEKKASGEVSEKEPAKEKAKPEKKKTTKRNKKGSAEEEQPVAPLADNESDAVDGDNEEEIVADKNTGELTENNEGTGDKHTNDDILGGKSENLPIVPAANKEHYITDNEIGRAHV